MIAQDEFSRLRLREFCGGDALYSDEPDEHGDFVCESIRGMTFARPVARPNDTFIIEVDLLDYSTDAGSAILARLGLPLTRNSTIDDVIRLLGQPTAARLQKPHDSFPSDWYEFRLGGGSGYVIACSFLSPGALNVLPCYQVSVRSLWEVRVARADLNLLFPEEPQGTCYLETITIEPAAVGSAQCFVEAVSLLTQPSAHDRIGLVIGFRLLPGMANPRIKLLIHNAAGQETTMIWLADPTIAEDRQRSIVHCIDRNLLPTSVIEFMIEEQNEKVVQTYRLPLAGFRVR